MQDHGEAALKTTPGPGRAGSRPPCRHVRQPDGMYVCPACGDTRSRPVRRPCPKAVRPAAKVRRPASVQDAIDAYRDGDNRICAFLGPSIRTFPRGVFSCADRSDTDVRQCHLLREAVTAAPVCRETAETIGDAMHALHVPGYRGRCCLQCDQRLEACRGRLVGNPVGNLAAVTAYFNPQHSTRRRENWFRFAEHLADQGIYLLTVEGVREGDSQDLPGVHAVKAVPFRDVLWQKERLLNVGIESLGPEVDAVAWLDADVIFERDDLREAILRELCEWPVIQPWAICRMSDGNRGWQKWRGVETRIPSVGATATLGRWDSLSTHPGFAWAARRDVLQAIGGLYDRHVLGGGDTAMTLGFFGDAKGHIETFLPTMLAHWKGWADVAHSVVAGRLGYVRGNITHLYHGSLENRRYVGRWKALSTRGYDPERHTRISESGALEWTDEAPPELREWCEDYLLNQRNEDA